MPWVDVARFWALAIHGVILEGLKEVSAVGYSFILLLLAIIIFNDCDIQHPGWLIASPAT